MLHGTLDMKWLEPVYPLLRWILGGVFVYSGITKLLAPQTFAVLIDAYGLVPEGLVLPVAVILPALELAAGAGLMVDIRGSLSVIAVLLVLFVAILGYGIGMGLDVDCGCFGPDDPEAEAFHGLRAALIRDLFMAAAVAFLYAWRRVRHIRPHRIRHLVQGRCGRVGIIPLIRKGES